MEVREVAWDFFGPQLSILCSSTQPRLETSLATAMLSLMALKDTLPLASKNLPLVEKGRDLEHNMILNMMRSETLDTPNSAETASISSAFILLLLWCCADVR